MENGNNILCGSSVWWKDASLTLPCEDDNVTKNRKRKLIHVTSSNVLNKSASISVTISTEFGTSSRRNAPNSHLMKSSIAAAATLNFCRAMLRISAIYAVVRCLSVRLSGYVSITFVPGPVLRWGRGGAQPPPPKCWPEMVPTAKIRILKI